MGKKSKKGTSRAGRTAHHAKGKGKTRSVPGRSKSVGSQASVASKEDVANLSFDSDPVMLATTNNNSMLPPNVDISLAKAVISPATNAATDENLNLEKTSAETQTNNADLAESDAAPSDELSASEEKDLWSNKLRDVVTEEVTEPAVLDVTVDEGHGAVEPESAPKVSVAEAVNETLKATTEPGTASKTRELPIPVETPVEASASMKVTKAVTETLKATTEPETASKTRELPIPVETPVEASASMKVTKAVTETLVTTEPESVSKTRELPIPLETPVEESASMKVQSRDIPSLDQPAKKEAQSHQKDCGCIIL